MIRLTDGTELEYKRFTEMCIVFDRVTHTLSDIESKVTTENLKSFTVTGDLAMTGVPNTDIMYKDFKVTSISFNAVEITVCIMRQNEVEVKMSALEAENKELRECIKELTQELYK